MRFVKEVKIVFKTRKDIADFFDIQNINHPDSK